MITELKKVGASVDNSLCEHFAFTRKELFDIVRISDIRTFTDLFKLHGAGKVGCEICKPTIASILASLFNSHILQGELFALQDSNDRYLANLQKNGSYSVIPRVPGGEITPEKLAVIAKVAQKYSLYTKLTGGQRIDLLGAPAWQLPMIWEDLVAAGFESGHAYGKALRTVKSCVGSTWCRFGRGDAVALAITLEERYRGIRSPHKLKGAVSGCIRECAEAQGKDFGLIATETGYNLYVGGNGGTTPKHAILLAADLPEELVFRYTDRFLMYYIHTADRLQRTSKWLEALDGGIEQLRRVIIDDALGLADTLEQHMALLIGTYQCEWKTVVEDPKRRAQFEQFRNTTVNQSIALVEERRDQLQPARNGVPRPVSPTSVAHFAPELLKWINVGLSVNFPRNAGAAILYGECQLAVFSIVDSTGLQWFATQNMCPHTNAFVLAHGIVGGEGSSLKVACPLHKASFDLENGNCLTNDKLHILHFKAKEEEDHIYLLLPPCEILNEHLATSKFVKSSCESHACSDSKLEW